MGPHAANATEALGHPSIFHPHFLPQQTYHSLYGPVPAVSYHRVHFHFYIVNFNSLCLFSAPVGGAEGWSQITASPALMLAFKPVEVRLEVTAASPYQPNAPTSRIGWETKGQSFLRLPTEGLNGADPGRQRQRS